MNPTMYMTCVPVFKQMLGGLGDVLRKAEAHATLKKIDPAALLQARLYPDMFALALQVQVACDFAASVSARLAGAEVPVFEFKADTFADLHARLDAVTAFISALSPAAFADSAARDIVLRPGTPKEKHLNGQTYLSNYGMPQFFFHVTTAYAVLRHNGVEVGKKDYMGAY